jgi:hypothetical protein
LAQLQGEARAAHAGLWSQPDPSMTLVAAARSRVLTAPSNCAVNSMGRDPTMDRHVTSSPRLFDPEVMIDRARAACERYRQAADQPGLGTLSAKWRRDRYRAMRKTLARLLGQRTRFNG